MTDLQTQFLGAMYVARGTKPLTPKAAAKLAADVWAAVAVKQPAQPIEIVDPASTRGLIEPLLKLVHRVRDGDPILRLAETVATNYDTVADALFAAATREQPGKQEIVADALESIRSLEAEHEARERQLREALETAQAHTIAHEQDGAIGLDWDYGAGDVGALTVAAQSLGYSVLSGERTCAGRVTFDQPLPPEILEWFRAKAVALPRPARAHLDAPSRMTPG